MDEELLAIRHRIQTALRSIQTPIQYVPEILSLVVKRPKREAEQLLSSSAEVKKEWRFTSTLTHVFMVWCLIKNDNFTF
jgi:hypothetical protein